MYGDYFYDYASVGFWSADELNPQPLPPGPPDPNFEYYVVATE